MKRLSSPFTLVFKYGFPAFVLFLFGTGLIESFSGTTRIVYLCTIFPLMAIGLSLVCTPLKSVYITKGAFVVGNGLCKNEISFSDIEDVKSTQSFGAPGAYPFVSLHMRNRSILRRLVAFFPSVDMRRNRQGNDEQIKKLIQEYSQ